MRTARISAFTLIALVIATAPPAHAWGRKAHETVARSAVQGLPDPMKAFFVTCRDYLAQHAEDPDNWREHDPAEGNRHYIDLELLPPDDWAALPPVLKDAEAKYGAEKMQKVGILPWRIVEMTEELATQMREGKWDDAKMTASALSHYVADAHQPLHCTLNYDGRSTGNDGIHGRFEIDMTDGYIVTPFVPLKPASETKDVFATALRTCLESNALVKDILQADTAARAAGPLDSPAYYLALAERSADVARQRIGAAAQMTADLWHTAWLRAGKPEFPVAAATVLICDFARKGDAQEHHGPPLVPVSFYEAVALRPVGPKTKWEREISWQQVTPDRMHLDPDYEKSISSGGKHLLISSEPVDEAAPTLGFTPAVSVGILEAAAQLLALPGVKRKIVVFSDGLAEERRFDAEALAETVKKAGVTIEIHAYGQDAVDDANLQALCRALGVELQDAGHEK